MRNIFIAILTLVSIPLFSQRIVTGTVTDSLGNEIAGVNIHETGTTNGAITDFNGKFNLTTLNDSAQLLFAFIGFSDKKITIHSDTTVDMRLSESIIEYYDFYNTKWLTVETQYDFFSSTYGIEISNGYDERPLIHFEDFSEDFIFKLHGNYDFSSDYAYGLKLGLKEPFRYVSLIAFEYSDYDYIKRGFELRDVNLSAESYIINLGVILKIAFHDYNEKQNIGIDLGLKRTLIYQKLYCEISGGYYFDYFSYSGLIQGFIYKDMIGLNLKYKRIDNYDFLNLGLSLTLERGNNNR